MEEKKTSEFMEEIIFDNLLFAIVVRTQFKEEGIRFFTPNHFSQQLGYMNRPKGYVIQPHVHNPVKRTVQYTKEMLYIKSGKVRVDFYSNNRDYLESRILNKGDIILLAYGGHGFEMIDSSEIIEVKQGPYAGDEDKSRFQGINSNNSEIKY